jgi:hypothetical protein
MKKKITSYEDVLDILEWVVLVSSLVMAIIGLGWVIEQFI